MTKQLKGTLKERTYSIYHVESLLDPLLDRLHIFRISQVLQGNLGKSHNFRIVKFYVWDRFLKTQTVSK